MCGVCVLVFDCVLVFEWQYLCGGVCLEFVVFVCGCLSGGICVVVYLWWCICVVVFVWCLCGVFV